MITVTRTEGTGGLLTIPCRACSGTEGMRGWFVRGPDNFAITGAVWAKWFCERCAPDDAGAMRAMIGATERGGVFSTPRTPAWITDLLLRLHALLAELEGRP